MVFFDLNGFALDAPDDDAYDLVIGVSTGALDYPAVAILLKAWTTGSASG